MAAPSRRLLLITPDFPPAHGGIQALMHGVAANLRELDPAVVALGGAAARAWDAASPLDVRRVPAGPRGHRASVALLNAAGLARALALRPAVVLAGHVVAAPAALAARRLAGVPVVQYVHADEFRTRPGLTARAVSEADATIAVSRYTRDLAVRAGAPEGRVHLVHPGVDERRAERAAAAARPPGEWGAPAGERAAPAGEWGGPAGERPPTLLTVARLTEHKGHDVVLRALPRVRDAVPGVRWVVVGDGERRGALEQLARERGVESAVRFAGAVGDAERDAWLAQADVFVMPSRVPPGGVGGEGFGIAYVEAGLFGVPSVAGDRGGAVDAVVDGETGLLVDATDPRAVADALVELLTDAPLRERLGAAARQRAREHAWPRVAERVEAVLAGVAR
ncbi:MAG TPA: glycosyltransferase family 4 protein [Solirubrobacteraceae bacterium]|nr:glycosyltransferase family 4 protein [Solirubrobacteraceae bacterium]